MTAMIATFRVRMEEKKGVVREFQIPATISLYRLAETIIDSIGWDFDHAFGFYNNLKGYFDSTEMFELFSDMEAAEPRRNGVIPRGVKKTRISTAFKSPGDKMLFLFDYGDEHIFHVEFLGKSKKEEGTVYPRMVTRKGVAPRQY